ncbi:MAG: hypothetical protein QOH26_1748 [Actinomycetota bacterium]|nr:hypothetical protein [Actinomycetota bacterium]
MNWTTKNKRVAAIGGGVAVLAAGALYLVLNKDVASKIPGLNQVVDPPKCPLSGVEPAKESLLDRPAIALKIENNPLAYPLSGLEEAEVVYEEPVEGGLTRFMAIFHCTDAAKAGPVRSARIVDPAILSPYTLILGDAGGNDIVHNALVKGGVVEIDETDAGEAMFRADRPETTFEHTLYADTAAVRKIGEKEFGDPPPDDIFEFGDVQKGKKVKTITATFSAGSVATFTWKEGRWYRSQGDEPLIAESGDQFAADNVLIEQHTVNFAEGLTDVLGTPSPEIADVTGTGKAWLFRDGRVIKGTWTRESEDDPVHFETADGDTMLLAEGSTWIELLPDNKGDVKGSLDFAK